ncbi:hypothetical protein [Methylocaldum sp.]|uniref:hypothetical protein n=1 Tax=Methylocaldum sp. TaxID=1969727 RepID=UPI002D553D21|nr:hypothetical protein [Methylocaldum sp.]HYE36080.1 hypothetical protein [Methylocaldum sp.]
MSLSERTAVLVIVSASIGVAMSFVRGGDFAAECAATDAGLTAIRAAIMGGPAGSGYRADVGEIPRSIHDLFDPASLPLPLRGFDPATGRGWRGPYLTEGVRIDGRKAHCSFSDDSCNSARFINGLANGDTGVLDGFGHHAPECTNSDAERYCRNPIVLQVPCHDANGNGACGDIGDMWLPGNARLVSAGPNGALETVLTDYNAGSRGDDRVLYLHMGDPGGGNRKCK